MSGSQNTEGGAAADFEGVSSEFFSYAEEYEKFKDFNVDTFKSDNEKICII